MKIKERTKGMIVERCQAKGVTVNSFLADMINREMSEEMDPGKVPKGRGVPMIGRIEFDYDGSRDNFTWTLNVGPRGEMTLAENVPAAFLESLSSAAKAALESRDKFRRAVPAEHVVVPAQLKEYVIR